MTRMVRLGYWAAVVGVCLLAAEAAARVEDWLTLGTPLLASPDRARDLVLSDATGVHGRPNGRFKRWRLNEYGFRGAPIERHPSPGCTRVVVLGASEMFGLYESEGNEFPAQLEKALSRLGSYEVVNAAMPGMTARRMLHFWEAWAAQFQPRVVLVYASPEFYLDEVPPSQRPPPPSTDLTAGPRIESRFVGRIRDLYHALPRWVKRGRESWVIARQTKGKPDDWLFRSVPRDRLDLYVADLGRLAAAIRARGARAVLLTHACRATAPPRPEDLDDARAIRMFYPRALPDVILAFERAAGRATLDLGDREGIEVIDGAQALDGRRDYFADLVHFTDLGAAALARLVCDRLGRRASAETAPPG